ncbi:MAG: SufE family protein [Chlamydiae bacterium]|nr:SufE family protein [Chlamydiota bacterium]
MSSNDTPSNSSLYGSKSIVKIFEKITSNEMIYQKIIELGSLNKNFPHDQIISENLVSGCQSTVYLYSYSIDNKLFFESTSDALISSGLAFIAAKAYSGLTAEEILKTPPSFIEEIGLHSNLTPSRSNGLQSMISLIKQKALQHYMKTSK